MRIVTMVIAAAMMVAAAALPAFAGCTASHVADVQVQFIGGYIFLPVTMNDVTGTFLLDTGSASTTVDSAFADKAGVGMDRHASETVIVGAGSKRTLPSFQGHVRITQIGALRFQDWEYVILDLGWMVREDNHVDGVLGMDFLHYFDVSIDVPDKHVTIWRLADCPDITPLHWKGDYDAIPLKHTANHNLTMPVMVDNVLLNMMFDTGAGSGVLLTQDAAAKAGVGASALAQDRATHGQGFGGKFDIARHRFSQFLIGSAVYTNYLVPVENERSERGETDGLIGLRPLDAQRIWISFTTNTLFVQRASQMK